MYFVFPFGFFFVLIIKSTFLLFDKAMASERELVLALVDPDAVADTGPTAHRFSKVSESDLGKVESDLTFILDRIFEGVCRPFKVRVEQVLQSQPNLVISYKLCNTLEFYSHTVSSSFTWFTIFVFFFLLFFYFSFPFFFLNLLNSLSFYRYQICLGENLHSLIPFGLSKMGLKKPFLTY